MPSLQYLQNKFTVKQRALLLVMSVILAIALLASVTIKDKTGMTLFSRLFLYDNKNTNLSFPHETKGKTHFTNLDYNLLTTSDRTVQVFTPQGESLLNIPITFTNPAISSNGKKAVIYDSGGQDLSVISAEEILFSLMMPSEEHILSSTINQNDWIAITSKKGGYKGVVTVYNESYRPVVSIQLSSSYLTNAIVAPDCKGIFVLTEGQADGMFESKLLYYSFDQSSTPKKEISLGDNLVLSMHATSNRCWVLTENKLFIFLSSGEIISQYDFSEKYIKFADLSGNDFATLLLSHSPTGNGGTLLTVDAEGFVLGSTEIDEAVSSVSSAGRYISLLTANSVQLFSKDMKQIHQLNYMQGVQDIVTFPNANIMLITDELASLLIP